MKEGTDSGTQYYEHLFQSNINASKNTETDVAIAWNLREKRHINTIAISLMSLIHAILCRIVICPMPHEQRDKDVDSTARRVVEFQTIKMYGLGIKTQQAMTNRRICTRQTSQDPRSRDIFPLTIPMCTQRYGIGERVNLMERRLANF